MSSIHIPRDFEGGVEIQLSPEGNAERFREMIGMLMHVQPSGVQQTFDPDTNSFCMIKTKPDPLTADAISHLGELEGALNAFRIPVTVTTLGRQNVNPAHDYFKGNDIPPNFRVAQITINPLAPWGGTEGGKSAIDEGALLFHLAKDTCGAPSRVTLSRDSALKLFALFEKTNPDDPSWQDSLPPSIECPVHSLNRTNAFDPKDDAPKSFRTWVGNLRRSGHHIQFS